MAVGAVASQLAVCAALMWAACPCLRLLLLPQLPGLWLRLPKTSSRLPLVSRLGDDCRLPRTCDVPVMQTAGGACACVCACGVLVAAADGHRTEHLCTERRLFRL